MPLVKYTECCDENGNVTDAQLTAAAEAAKNAKVAVVVAGLPDIYESEAIDRESMALPDGHNKMIEAVAAVNPNTVVVLLGGSAMELPWIDRVKAVLYSNPAFKMTMICATDCPLRAVVINSNGAMSDKTARGLLEMANGHFIKGIIKMIKD